MKIPGSGRILENGVSCLPSTSTPTPQAEKQVIAELTARAESNLREGNLYYVVSMRWYTCWQNYVGQDAKSCSSIGQFVGVPEMLCRPGPIDNSELVLNVNGSDDDDDPEIIRTLEEERDYVLVPAEAWNKLFEWYNGGPPLPRKLICQGAAYKQFNVEVYPLRLQLTDARDNSQTIIRLSKKATLHEFYEKVCMCKGLELDKVRIWDYFNKSKGLELCPSDQTLEESNLLMDQDVLLDLEDCACSATASGGDSIGKELILVPMEPSRSSMTIAGGPAFSNGHSTHYVSNLCSGSALTSARASKDDGYDRFGIAGTDERTGLAGLQNLGNTCFMNSALQCLVHTPSLVHYFLQDYSDEINKNNPLGMGGELAVAFGDLLRSMWSTGRTTVAPRQFKGKVARFAPQFSGYNQHDSQEFLAFLLDGLHEDLNRVKQKPYIEMKDSDGRPDAEYADECWKNHKTRNDSIIVDICQGQYKSTLVCPVCYKISITFDPFMYLTLPLPSTVNRTMTVTVFYGDGSGLPMPYTVLVPKHGCIRDLYHALSTACCLRNVEILLLAEVYNHKIYRYLEVPLEPLSSIKDDDHIVAYRVPEKEPGLKRIEILHQHTEMSDNLKVHDEKLLGTPLVTYIGEEDPTTTIIDSAICRVLSPLRKSTFVGSSKAHEDGCDLEEIGNQAMATCSYENEGGCRLMEDAEGGRMFSFKLLVDQRGSTKMQIEEDYAMKTGQVVRVMLNWTNNLLKSYDISFLEDLPVVCKSGFTAKKTRQETISLFSCLEAFLKEEPLGPDDMWYCPQCKEHRQATKKLDLWRLPEILVIHLKRFSYNRYLKNKLDSFVNFPIHNLDLSKYIRTMASCRASHVYELYAISNHYGGLGGGHYTAYAKLVNDSTWYHFDDSHVSPVGEGDIVTSAGYVLFYRRVYVRDEIQAGKSANGSCSVREA